MPREQAITAETRALAQTAHLTRDPLLSSAGSIRHSSIQYQNEHMCYFSLPRYNPIPWTGNAIEKRKQNECSKSSGNHPDVSQ